MATTKKNDEPAAKEQPTKAPDDPKEPYPTGTPRDPEDDFEAAHGFRRTPKKE